MPYPFIVGRDLLRILGALIDYSVGRLKGGENSLKLVPTEASSGVLAPLLSPEDKIMECVRDKMDVLMQNGCIWLMTANRTKGPPIRQRPYRVPFLKESGVEPSERGSNEHARMYPSGQEKAGGGSRWRSRPSTLTTLPQPMETQEQQDADQGSDPVHPNDLGAPIEEQPSAPPPKRGQAPIDQQEGGGQTFSQQEVSNIFAQEGTQMDLSD